MLEPIVEGLPIEEVNRRLGRGINLGNCFEAPKEGAWGIEFKPEYFAAIRAAGFHSVRLPVKWSAHAEAHPPYALEPKFAARIDGVLDAAAQHHLNVVLNVHHYDEMDNEPARHAPRLLGIWRHLAKRFRDRPASVLFELLNEPHGALGAAQWNPMIPALISTVRQSNPTRALVVGPDSWNSIDALPKLKLTEDARVIVGVHCYEPFNFTHQSAPWVKGSKAWAGRKWEGTPEDEKFLTARLGKAALWGKANHRPVYLGEFGSFQAADLPSRVRWTRFMVREAERLGLSWAYWEFCSGFGAYDPVANAWRQPLLAALIPPAAVPGRTP